MLDFTWKVFEQTGNVNTYLLFKQMEQERFEGPEDNECELAEAELPFS
ncbi:YqzL family protein [Bacillus sp. HMF5848]|nr:YqzL family protein [Bacillus sp. HMF5848]RSK27883.1 YqzL family protein [Bacillus sp. HMF5848]